MYIVIVGSTNLAIELARQILHRKEDKVVLIIKNKEEALRINEDLQTTVINADFTKTKALDDLELNKCDVFVSANQSEKDNLLSAVYAKDAGAKKIFVCVDSKDSEPILKKLGFIPINADDFAARAVELMLSRPAVSDLVNLGIGQFDIIEVPASETKLIDKEISQAKGKHFTAIAAYENGNYHFAKERHITPQDTLLLIVGSGKEKEAEKEIGRTGGQKLDFLNKIGKK